MRRRSAVKKRRLPANARRKKRLPRSAPRKRNANAKRRKRPRLRLLRAVPRASQRRVLRSQLQRSPSKLKSRKRNVRSWKSRSSSTS